MYDKEVRVAFPIIAKQTNFKDEIDGEKNIHQVAGMLFARADRYTDSSDTPYTVYLKKAAESIRMIDRSKRVLDGTADFYRAYVLDKVQFIAAEVIDMEVYGNKDCYIKVNYAGNDKNYNGTVQIPAETYYRLLDDHTIDISKPIYIIGTCVRKEHKIGTRKRWDKYSMKLQTISEAAIRKKTKMLHFYLGNRIE